jgi:predicted RNA-binding Zn-ribbon protein involved in translation (DUF1610 family)
MKLANLASTIRGGRQRGLTTRDLVLLLVGVVVLGVALYFMTRPKVEDEAPADKFVSFYCPNCDYFFQRSEREHDESFEKKHEFKTVGARGMLFKCAKCGQITAERRDEPPPKGPAKANDQKAVPPGG